MMDRLAEGKHVFDMEIDALVKTRDSLDDTYLRILDLITSCTGKVIVTGIGKPGHIAAKLAATFASLGTPSFRLHPAEAMHGDLGMISNNDVVIAISYSGESDEIVCILPAIKLIGAKIVGITGNGSSTLAKESDIVQVLPHFEEACNLGLAPTTSTTVELCYGDALAVVASDILGFSDVDFGKIHPAGALGKKLLLRVADIMASQNDNAVINIDSSMRDIVEALSEKKLSMVNIIDEGGKFCGIITGGDFYRYLDRKDYYSDFSIEKIMKRSPITIAPDKLAVEALQMMRRHSFICMPVLKGGELMGTITMQMILSAGIVL